MCGRFVSARKRLELLEEFSIERDRTAEGPDSEPGPDYNVAPTKRVFAVMERPGEDDEPPARELRVVRWGLVPFWAKDSSGGGRLINARAETVAVKPAFRRAFAKRRCILPADGYYEWMARTEQGKQRKQPYFIHRGDGGALAFAGVYELPFGPDTHMLTNGSWLSHALANISMSGTFYFTTGEPLTPHYEANIEDVARGSAGSLRPDRVQSQSITAGGGTIRNWFNQAAFTQPTGVYGTASRYSIPGPGTVSFNASLSKSVRFGDMRSLEVRATSSNIFNTVQYAGVDTTVSSATYGQITSAGQMRQFTFLARYRF